MVAAPPRSPSANAREERSIGRPDVAVYVAIITLVATLAFVLYALGGGDLCLWCGTLGR